MVDELFVAMRVFLDKQCERSEIFVSQRQSKNACEYKDSDKKEIVFPYFS